MARLYLEALLSLGPYHLFSWGSLLGMELYQVPIYLPPTLVYPLSKLPPPSIQANKHAVLHPHQTMLLAPPHAAIHIPPEEGVPRLLRPPDRFGRLHYRHLPARESVQSGHWRRLDRVGAAGVESGHGGMELVGVGAEDDGGDGWEDASG